MFIDDTSGCVVLFFTGVINDVGVVMMVVLVVGAGRVSSSLVVSFSAL